MAVTTREENTTFSAQMQSNRTAQGETNIHARIELDTEGKAASRAPVLLTQLLCTVLRHRKVQHQIMH